MNRSPSLRSALALALTLGATAPAPASVTFFSDRAIEGVAAKLKLPEGAAVEMPRGRAARIAELGDIVAEVAAAKRALDAVEGGVLSGGAALEAKVAALQAIALTPADRHALSDGGLAAVRPELRQAIEAAGGPLAAANDELRAYFAAYDAYQRATIRGQIFAMASDIAEKRNMLQGEYSRRKLRKLDKKIRAFTEAERRFRIFFSHPEAKNHHKALTAIVCQRRGAQLVAKLDVAMGEAGLAEKVPVWRQRFARFGRELKGLVRAGAGGVAALPGVARTLGYLYNPFRKQSDPAKAVAALRSAAKGFRKGVGIRLDIEGAEKVPEGMPVIFAYSHRSEFEDAMLMMGATPGREYSFMMGQWAFPGFLNHKLAAEKTTINVGGSYKDGQKVNAIKESVTTLKEGRNLVIFPEGMTPTDAGETQEVRRGIDVIAKAVSREPVAVVGVTLADPANEMGGPRMKALGGPMTVKVLFHAPLDPLLVHAVPGAGADLMRNILRVRWHRDLFGAEGSTSQRFELPSAAGAAYDAEFGE